MEALIRQRCLHHATREAVARCPECGSFYCRECITEHDDRVICADCLRRLSQAPAKVRRRWVALPRLLKGAAGLVLAWYFFYQVGKILLRIPTTFHDGTLWQTL